MRRFIVLIIVALGLVAALPQPADSIGNGVPDGNGHPNVGILLFEEEGQPAVFCSGSLIAPQVFLTAGHCIEAAKRIGASNIWVSFDSTFDPAASPRIPASSFRAHPLFNPATGNLFNDLGVVLLSRPAGVAPVALPPANLLGDMKEAGTIDDQTFTNVGYGLVPHHKQGPPSFFPFDGVRRVSTSPYAGLTPEFLHLLDNVDATGEGGTCLGDSGSPKFLGSSNMIVAVTSWGDAVCRASTFSPRLDIPSARAFLDDYVRPLP